jgi:hypothetical protein
VKSGKDVKRTFIPEPKPIAEKSELAMTKFYSESGRIQLPLFMSRLDDGVLITNLSVDGDKLKVTQGRSDGTVKFENEIDLALRPFEEVKIAPSGWFSCFTADLVFLRGLLKTDLWAHMAEGKPLSLAGSTEFGHFKGIIGNLKYER